MFTRSCRASRLAMLYVLLFFLLYAGNAAFSFRSRFDFYDDYYTQLFENDPNLNAGFDIDAFREHQLYLHNHYRHKHGVPLMTSDDTLTQQAQEYAEELALNDQGLVHCFNLEGCNYYGAAENLASAEGYTDVEANATVMWYNEIWDYNFCTTGTLDRCRPGHEHKIIGHFTQMVWGTSTSVGFGYARTSDRFKVYVVARYKQHGNVIGYYNRYVRLPAYILDTFEDNCYGIDGGLSDWMDPGPCTCSCGGGVRFSTKTCTNPKPSLNGRDCEGETKELIPEWCNAHVCSGGLSHRDLQCAARGETADAHNFGGIRDCLLHCRISDTHFLLVGHVDDGTHCDYDSGACVSGMCYDMPDYVVATRPPSTSSATTSVLNRTTTEQPEVATTKPATIISTTEPTTQPEVATTKPATIISTTVPTTQPGVVTTKQATIISATVPTTQPEVATTKLATTISTTVSTTQPGVVTTKQATIISTTVPTTQPESTRTTPSPTPARKLVTGAFNQIPRKRFERILTIPSGATDIVIQNSKPRNARISVRFQKGNRKPRRYRKKYGKEMMPFSEQIGRGSIHIMPMVSIEGPIKPGFKVIIYIHRRRRKRPPSVTWRYWTRKRTGPLIMNESKPCTNGHDIE